MKAPTVAGEHVIDRPALELPPASGVRALRRRRRRQERRQRRLLVGLLVLAVAATGFVVTRPQGSGEVPAAVPAATRASTAVTGNVLMAHRGADGATTWLALAAPLERQPGGAIVLVHPGTMTEIATLGLEPVGRALELAGPARLDASVENLLGVDVDRVVVFDDQSLTAFASALGPLRVRIPARVEHVRDDGTVEVLWEEGLTKLRPADVPQLLSARGDTGLGSLARHQAFWQAALAEVEGSPPGRLGRDQAALWRTLDRVRAGDGRVRVLPVEPVGRSSDGPATDDDAVAAADLYQVRAVELKAFLTSAFPEDAARIGSRPRVQILNGAGTVELAPRVEGRLVPAGFRVTLIGNASRFDHDETQIVFYDRAERPLAERVRRALGVGRLVLSRRPVGVVDVTIIVGKDFDGR